MTFKNLISCISIWILEVKAIGVQKKQGQFMQSRFCTCFYNLPERIFAFKTNMRFSLIDQTCKAASKGLLARMVSSLTVMLKLTNVQADVFQQTR